MTKNILKNLIVCTTLCFLLAGCGDGDEPKTNDPGAPVVVNRFYPTAGGVGTEILITGRNFSEDRAQISVTLGDRKLPIVNCDMNNIMVVVPKKLGSGNLTVQVGKHEAVSTLEKFTYNFSAVVTTLAGSGEAGYVDGSASEAMFCFDDTPELYRKGSICVDAECNVYVGDIMNYCIRKITPDGEVTTFAGLGGVPGRVDGSGSSARFALMYGMDCDSEGNIYVATADDKTLRRVTPAGVVSTVATANFQIWSVGVARTTNTVWVGDYYGGVYRWDGGNDFTRIGDDMAIGIVAAPNGDVYVSTFDTYQIIRYKATSDGWAREVFAGSGEAGYEDGPLLEAKFASPRGLAMDSAGDIYIAGNGGYPGNADESIRRIDLQAAEVITIAGGGAGGYVNANGTDAAFNGPQDLTIDRNGAIYVFDKMNNVVRKIVYE